MCKKETLARLCFPVNFAKFLRTPFFIEHLSWLLLPRFTIKSGIKVYKSNIQGEPLSLLEIFFDNFEQRLGQNSEWKSIRSWVPQWSVLGLFLFLISINDMSDIILLICKIFNDDTSLFLEVLHVNESLELNMDLILNPKKQQSFFLGNWIIVRILHLHSITTSISLSSQKTSGCCVRLSKTLKSAAKQ